MIKNLINKFLKPKSENQIKEGTVKFFNNSKGFGFIILKDSEDEIFVHKNGLIDRIREKDNVTFDVEQTEKGPSAINVKKV
ncbi:cold shock domain-containing protein [Xanthomarina sp. F1114]|uniref:cold-shock protein n=1 Tax=Xanthomarina sp. F1114 TaxID=2996019 RepID=UPI002B21D128|nr:cold shock domain-containing protein [Xanthomarina sp. F1114]